MIAGSAYTNEDHIYNVNLENRMCCKCRHHCRYKSILKTRINKNPRKSDAYDDEKALEQFKQSVTKKKKNIGCGRIKDRIKCHTFGLWFPTTSDVVQTAVNVEQLKGRTLRSHRRSLRFYFSCLQLEQSNIIEEISPNMNRIGIIHYLPITKY
ncbi:hypothetical protein DINM_006917 [Dirofilaria immitis]|nr:hypothetical protein [Dirofilaria immitis]